MIFPKESDVGRRVRFELNGEHIAGKISKIEDYGNRVFVEFDDDDGAVTGCWRRELEWEAAEKELI